MIKNRAFLDRNDNRLACWLNAKGLLYIEVKDAIANDIMNYGWHITLNKEDVGEFIEILRSLHNQMPTTNTEV